MNEPMSKERREALLTEARKFGSATLTPAGLEQLLSTAERIERLDEKYHEEKLIVDRIWKMLGCTTYADVKGKSIYELIEDVQSERDKLRTQLAAVTKERNELKQMFDYLVRQIWETRWVCDESDYQSMVGTAAEIRSRNFDGIRAAMQKKGK